MLRAVPMVPMTQLHVHLQAPHVTPVTGHKSMQSHADVLTSQTCHPATRWTITRSQCCATLHRVRGRAAVPAVCEACYSLGACLGQAAWPSLAALLRLADALRVVHVHPLRGARREDDHPWRHRSVVEDLLLQDCHPVQQVLELCTSS